VIHSCVLCHTAGVVTSAAALAGGRTAAATRQRRYLGMNPPRMGGVRCAAWTKAVSTQHITGLFAAMISLALIVAGCANTAGPPPSSGPPPSNQAGPLPPECVNRVTDSHQANAAVQRVRPGGIVCLSGEGLTAAELVVRSSGTAQQPVTIIADGGTMRSLNVEADYVVIQGLTLRDGDGQTVTGRGLVARNNVIYNATADGRDCRDCVDTIIESNIVDRADGTQIRLSGRRITVRNNTVSDSVLPSQGDADGIRFLRATERADGRTYVATAVI
jgi:hypothetical protein